MSTALSVTEFERHFKSLYKPLCLFALQYLHEAADAEDIVQQAFADVWEKNREGSTIGNLKAYLYQAVRNRSITQASRQPLYETSEEFPDLADTTDEERMAISERDARLWRAIDGLPPERKKIFLLSKRDGLKYQEIADLLHISVKTVENQIGKALKSLRDTAVRIYTFFFG